LADGGANSRHMMTKYGILDFDGEVVRWTFTKPSDCYQYITIKVKKIKKPGIDWSNYEPALF
jgi:hypothetical protein